MPRVTRRSVAAKEESAPEESSRSTSRGRRGAKKEEPAVEDVAVGEPQEIPTKRGGRQAPKGRETAAAKGRSAPRGGRGKKEEEPEENEEEEEEEEETKPQRGGARSRGRAKGGRGGKAAAAKGGRSTSRGKKGKAAEPEEDDEEEDEKEQAAEEADVPAKGRGGRSRAKAASATPPARSGRRGRGKAAAEENEEEESVSKEEIDKTEETSKEVEENEVVTTPKGRQRRTPNKAAEPKGTPPSSGGRRGRGQKAEPSPQESSSTGKRSRQQDETAPAEVVEEKKDDAAAEPMETESTAAPVEKKEADTKEPEKAVPSAPEAPKETSNEAASSSKKRALEEEKEEVAAKRPKTSESETPKEAKNELEDFVVVNKDDVPAPDSKEVTEALPPPVPAKSSEPATPEDARPEGPKLQPVGPFMVPLTEAELAKQYTTLQRQDRDETSSTLVEVGSEGAGDVTALSSRGLDVSDATSLDSVSLDQHPRDSVSEQAMDTSSSSSLTVSENSTNPIIQITAPPNPVAQDVSQQVNAAKPFSALQQNISSNATPPLPPGPAPPAQPSSVVVTNISQPSQPPPAPIEVHAGTVHECNALAAPPPPPQPPQAPSQNGTPQGTTPVNSTPAPAPNLVKPITVAPSPYIPSSTAIDCRKFILNPAFPLEMMDPAFCFSVVTYNILADCHLRRQDYSYTQPQFLNQDYRHALLLKELDYLDGDIVCMQEVNQAYYLHTLLPAMKSRGYEGHFINRTKDYWDEGEATLVRSSKFDIVSQQGVSLRDLALTEVNESGVNPDVHRAATKYLDRADVILLLELLCKKTGKKITVCNIHVGYDPAAPDVQCIQVACAVKQLVAKAGNDLNPHIICGDFNSPVTSPGYQLAKDGYLSDAHIHKLQGIEALDNTDGSSRSLINHMWRSFQHTSSNLRSAYELTMGKEPPITTLSKTAHHTLDYIFHSAASIDTVGVLETLDLQVVEDSGGLPSSSIPSDHLSLKAVFRLK